MAKRITFPVVKGTNRRRNAETGVEIVKSERYNGDGTYYTVETPFPAGDRFWSTPTLVEARAYAEERAEELRRLIAEAYDEALDEDAHREALAICASIPREGRPDAVTALLTAAELLTDEHEHLAAVRHARKAYDEADEQAHADLTEARRLVATIKITHMTARVIRDLIANVERADSAAKALLIARKAVEVDEAFAMLNGTDENRSYPTR